jgi:hypothetical protein
VKDGNKQRPLLAICPLVYERDHGAASYFETLKSTLEWYGLNVDSMLYLISDNCSTMRSLARDYLYCPFIGCYAHKLNLAVKRWLCNPIRLRLIEKVRFICVKLRTMLNTAHLRELTLDDFVQPLIDQETRWSSIFNMLQRFVRLRDTIILMQNRELDLLMPNEAEYRDILSLNIDMSEVNQFTVKLQQSDITISVARKFFDHLIEKYGDDFNHHLSSEADLILDTNFDNGLIKVINNEENQLTMAEEISISNSYSYSCSCSNSHSYSFSCSKGYSYNCLINITIHVIQQNKRWNSLYHN